MFSGKTIRKQNYKINYTKITAWKINLIISVNINLNIRLYFPDKISVSNEGNTIMINKQDIVSVLSFRTNMHANYSAKVIENVRKLITFAIINKESEF